MGTIDTLSAGGRVTFDTMRKVFGEGLAGWDAPPPPKAMVCVLAFS